ncbi:MAG: hypothetical protein ACR2MP_33330 [Streptosporangiaceae bacterium]
MGLDEHAQLVVIVGALDGDPVHAGTHGGPQDLPGHGQVTVAVLGVHRRSRHPVMVARPASPGPPK